MDLIHSNCLVLWMYEILISYLNIKIFKLDATIPFMSQAYTLKRLGTGLTLLIAITTNHISMYCKHKQSLAS